MFTPYYDQLPPLWEVVANINSSFWRASYPLEGLNHQSSTYPAFRINLSSVVNQVTRGTLSYSR